jgi:hypothetical protein
MANYANPQDPQPPLQAADIRIPEPEALWFLDQPGPIQELEYQRRICSYVNITRADSIGFRAFFRCRFLQVVELPISIEIQKIYREAFSGCSKLKYIICDHPNSDVIRQKVRFDAQVIRRSELPAGYYSWGSSDKISWLEDHASANEPNDNQSDTSISFPLSLQ